MDFLVSLQGGDLRHCFGSIREPVNLMTQKQYINMPDLKK